MERDPPNRPNDNVKVIMDPSPHSTSHSSHSNLQRKPPGPQLWAIVLTLAVVYYFWTRILGRPLPSFLSFQRSGHRIGKVKSSNHSNGSNSSNGSASDMQAARERQQQRLMNANRAREMVQNARERNVRERNTNPSNSNAETTHDSQQQQHKQKQLEQQKQLELAEKKKKQRQLYLRQKALKEKEDEERRKDEELGPGWRYREDPNGMRSVNGAMNSMDPQAGGEVGGGGYKPPSCTRKGG